MGTSVITVILNMSLVMHLMTTPDPGPLPQVTFAYVVSFAYNLHDLFCLPLNVVFAYFCVSFHRFVLLLRANLVGDRDWGTGCWVTSGM